MTQAQRLRWINRALAGALGLNLLFWLASHDTYSRWAGVPPVPDREGALAMTLSDAQFSFRFGAMTLQNLGNSGGQVTPIRDYDYQKLAGWFALLDGLDPASDHVPMLAAYYFGATTVPEDVGVVVDYLARAGDSPVGTKWRWLAHAVFLARHRMDNLPLALDLAYKLAKLQTVDDEMPLWARQMPAFVLSAGGDHEDARKIIENILLTAPDLHPNEVNFMRVYLEEQLGVPAAEVERVMQHRAALGLRETERLRQTQPPKF